jgi:hypothetical protein
LCSFVDQGAAGTGEPLAVLLRPGSACSKTAADHISVTRDALRQLPFTARGGRVGRKVLIRTDAAGATHEFLNWPGSPETGLLTRIHPACGRRRTPGPHPRPGVDSRLRRLTHTP